MEVSIHLPTEPNVCISMSLSAARGRRGPTVRVSAGVLLSDVPLGQQGCARRWIIKPALTPPYHSYEVMVYWGLNVPQAAEVDRWQYLVKTANEQRPFVVTAAPRTCVDTIRNRNKSGGIQQACSNIWQGWSKQWTGGAIFRDEPTAAHSQRLMKSTWWPYSPMKWKSFWERVVW